MRVRVFWIAGLLALAVAAMTLSASGPALAGKPPPGGGDADALRWNYSDEGEAYYRNTDDGSSPGQGEPPEPNGRGYYEATLIGKQPNPELSDGWLFDCVGNEQYTGCDATTYTCWGLWDQAGNPYAEPPDGRPAFPYIHFRQHESWVEDTDDDGDGDFDPEGRLEYTGWDCVPVSDEDYVSEREIRWRIDRTVIQELGKPKIDLKPVAETVVNWPTIVWTEYPDNANIPPPAERVPGDDPVALRIPINIPRPGEPLVGEMRAEAEFSWDFGDGESAEGRGEPYIPGHYPQDAPGYYLTHEYDTKGRRTITLTVLWTGYVTVPGLVEDQPIDPVERTSTEDVDVSEGEPVLVD